MQTTAYCSRAVSRTCASTDQYRFTIMELHAVTRLFSL
uniref:Uncharacterized protein n=1 Tax=Arundo donax TaxID=35708 RepID=A0A0A9CEK0_ARUDO